MPGLLSALCLQAGTAPEQLVCVGLCKHSTARFGIGGRSAKTHPVPEERGGQRNAGQVGLDSAAQQKRGLHSPDSFSVDLKVSAH